MRSFICPFILLQMVFDKILYKTLQHDVDLKSSILFAL